MASELNHKGIIMIDSSKAPEDIRRFLDHLKKEGSKGKIAIHPDFPPQFFSPYATMDREYYEGYQIFLVDLHELETKEKI